MRRLLVWFVPAVAVAAALTVLLVVSAKDTPDTDEGETSMADVPPPAADPQGISWRRVESESFAGGTGMTAVARGGGLFVAVGTTAAGAGAWTSVDGSSWESVPGEVFGVATEATGVAARDGLMVVAGVADEVTPLVWTSRDGGSGWRRENLPGSPLGRPRGVALSSDPTRGMVVVGTTLGEARDAAVWWSKDGTEWIAVDDADLRSDTADLAILAVTATSQGFVAVGTENDMTAAAWVSEDGRTWDRIQSQSFQGEGDLSMWGVAAGSGGVVAVGHRFGDRIEPATWFSPDGRTWERTSLDKSGERTMWGVTASQRGWVAVGSAAADTRAALWHSEDGREWVQYDEIDVAGETGPVSVYAAGASDELFVAVGGAGGAGPGSTEVLVLTGS